MPCLHAGGIAQVFGSPANDAASAIAQRRPVLYFGLTRTPFPNPDAAMNNAIAVLLLLILATPTHSQEMNIPDQSDHDQEINVPGHLVHDQEINIPGHLVHDAELTGALQNIVARLGLDHVFDIGDYGTETISFAVIDLNSAEPRIGGVHMDNLIYPASVYKMYVAAEVLNQVSQGEYGLFDPIAVGDSSTFLTLISHLSNTLVMGPSGYKFNDYYRMGLPLEIIIVLIGTPLILFFWPA